jgi:hypothetical protein
VLGIEVMGCEYAEHRHAERSFGGAVLELVTQRRRRRDMGGLIYLVGLIVIILFILSFLGLR